MPLSFLTQLGLSDVTSDYVTDVLCALGQVI